MGKPRLIVRENLIWIAGPAIAGGGLGLALVLGSPSLRRLLIAQEAIERRVARRAAAAFLEFHRNK